MKKNVPSDSLEEFLKNAFEEYTESPSEEVWERIAAETKAPPKAPFKVLRSYPFWIVTAAALLAGFIIYNAIKVNQEIQHINKAVEQQQVEIDDLQKQDKQESGSPQNKKLLPQASIDNERIDNERVNNEGINNERVNNERNVIKNHKGQSYLPNEQNLAENSKTQQNKKVIYQNNKRILNASKKGTNTSDANNSIENQVNTNIPITQQSSETIYPFIPTVGLPSEGAIQPAVANVFELNRLVTSAQFLEKTHPQDKISVPPALQLPIKSLREKTGFYAGVNALAMKNWSSIAIKTARPIPPHSRKEFNQPNIDAGNSMAFGVQIGTKIGKNLSLESGILHRTNTTTSTHEPMFKFKDRKFPHTGGSPRDCQFEYDLNTPTGTVAMAITVESVASSIPDEEEVTLEITTDQSLLYLSVPLLLNYQIGKSKLHLNAKGGVLTNFLLDNDFNITSINSANINFRPQPNQPFQSEPLYFSHLSLDYLLQLGIAYDLTNNMSINITPTFIGSLSNTSSNRFIQSSNYSAGLSTGLTWSF